MASKVITKVGPTNLVEDRLWSIPDADLGDKVGYLPPGESGIGKAEWFEAKVVKISMEQMLDKEGYIVEATVYTLDNGLILDSDEVEYVIPAEG